MTDMVTKAKVEDIKRLAKRAKQSRLMSLFEQTEEAAEAEAMVSQTLQASVAHHKEHGVAFSWLGDRVSKQYANRTAYSMLRERGYFVEEKRERKKIVIVTQKLVEYLDKYFARKDAKK